MKTIREKAVLEAAIKAVYHATGIKMEAIPEVKKKGKIIDAEVTVQGYKKARFDAEIKKWAQHANFGGVVNQIRQLPGKGMLVADYVNPKMADRLRELDIPYIDTVGNVYINEKPLYLFVKTTKAKAGQKENLIDKPQGRALYPTGLKVVYQFLKDERLLNAPYREIAAKADVALGTIGWVFNDLKQGGFLIEAGKKNRRLKRKRQLLDKWVDGYLQKLRPKLEVGVFRTDNPDWWKQVGDKILNYEAKWGGEIAAHEFTGYLKPQEITIYLENDDIAQFFNKYKFRKDPGGDIHVYRAFWNKDEHTEGIPADLVHPLITYADLIATGDVRNLEAAQELLEGAYAEFIRED